MQRALSVTELNEQIKSVLETTLSSVYVEGEISNLTYHNSGHIYFSIKDMAGSTISCVMFRGNARYLKFRLEMGQKILINGNITVYTPRGNYQLLCSKITPSGVGELSLAYEQLKAKLQIKGYFNKERKKPLPRFPKKIYIITSNTGAAIEDMKKVLAHRYSMAKIILLPTLVQGVGAKEDISRNIQLADSIAKKENDSFIIVGRGGGSLEDLWAFNEEIVADAIFNATTPIVSAVGHENDVVISDFVADLRASTPSNAIEITTPDINELRVYLDTISMDLINKMIYILEQKTQEVLNYKKLFLQHSFEKKFLFIQEQINHTRKQFSTLFDHQILLKQNSINNLRQTFEVKKPASKDLKGLVQLSKDDFVSKIEDIEIDDIINLQNTQYTLQCKVLNKKKFE